MPIVLRGFWVIDVRAAPRTVHESSFIDFLWYRRFVVVLTKISSRQKTISLNLAELRFFSDLVRLHWDEFVEEAPEEWKEDSWIQTRSPVGIVSLYGQNRPLVTTGEPGLLEGARWRDSRDYTKAKWLSYAVATHYEYRCSSPLSISC
jgi:hypothetical protein